MRRSGGGGGGGRGGGVRRSGGAVSRAVRVHVGQLQGRAHLRLVGVVLLQVASQRAVVAAAVRAVLPPAQRGAAGAADVDVDVVVDVGGWRSSECARRLGSGCSRWNRRWAGEGGAGRAARPRGGGAGAGAFLLGTDRRWEFTFLAPAKHPTPHLLQFLLLIIVIVVVLFLLLVLLAVRVAGLRVGKGGGGR